MFKALKQYNIYFKASNTIVENNSFKAENSDIITNSYQSYLNINSNSTANRYINRTNLTLYITVEMMYPLINNSNNRMWGLVFKIYNSTNNLITTYSPETSDNINQSFLLLKDCYFTF
jgi:hypothetical protein